MVFLVPSEISIGSPPPGHPAVITDGTATVTGSTAGVISMTSATLLGDASDASYFEHWVTSTDVYSASVGSASIVLNPTPGYVLADLPLSVRAEMVDAGTTSVWSTRFLFDVYDNSTFEYLGWFSYVYGNGIELPGSGSVWSIDNIGFVPDPVHGKTLADLNFSLQNNGLQLNLSAFTGNTETGVTRMLRVYELTFGAVSVSFQSTMRKYPNPTGLGVGPARGWPKPRRGITGIR